MNVTKEEVIQKAVDLFKAEGSIDVIKLAQMLDIDIYAKEEDKAFNSEISYDRTLDKYFIVINADHPLVRQRFSIAHEIAHYLLHPQKVKKEGFLNREIVGEEVNPNIEEEADKIAADILLPDSLVLDYCREHSIQKDKKITEEVINSLADFFKVSRIVALLKLRHLNFYVPYIAFS